MHKELYMKRSVIYLVLFVSTVLLAFTQVNTNKQNGETKHHSKKPGVSDTNHINMFTWLVSDSLQVSFFYRGINDSTPVKMNPTDTTWKLFPASDTSTIHVSETGYTEWHIKQPGVQTFTSEQDSMLHTLHLRVFKNDSLAPPADKPGVHYFGPGIHVMDSLMGQTLVLESNRSIYIDSGAVVKAFIKAENAEHIKIYGNGVLMAPNDTSGHNIVDIEACSGIEISGINIIGQHSDNAVFIYKSYNITLGDISVINPSGKNNKGITIANCTDADISDCFIRSGGNTLSIKGLGNNRNYNATTIDPGTSLPNSNISVRNCALWSEKGSALAIGPETMAEFFSELSVSNCQILKTGHKTNNSAISIIALHSTELYNFLFDSISIYDPYQSVLIKNADTLGTLTGSQQWPGEIHHLALRNIQVKDTSTSTITILGWDSTKMIHNIGFENLVFGSDTVKVDDQVFNLNAYTRTILLNSDTIKKPVRNEPVTSTEN